MELVNFSTTNPKFSDCPGYTPKIEPQHEDSPSLGVIVLQEWWGANDNIKERALDLFNKYGWITLVPDLYRGKVTIDREEAHHLMSGLDFGGAVQDIQGAASYLKHERKCQKVAVVGFCMGGALALLSATAGQNSLDATCAYYGIPGAAFFDVSKLKIPALGHFGNLDQAKGFSAPEDVDNLEKSAKEAGVDIVLYRYDADHAFDHVGGPNYDQAASELAEKRTVEFLNGI